MNNFERELDKQLRSMPKEMEPERDLWRGIELSLNKEAPPAIDETRGETVSTKQWLAIAASVCLVSVLWFFVPQMVTPDSNKLEGYALVDALSQQQSKQVATLLTSYKNAAELSDDWKSQLQELDEAADAIKVALQDDPDNGALLRMLHHVYQQQIDLIERVHAPKWQQI